MESGPDAPSGLARARKGWRSFAFRSIMAKGKAITTAKMVGRKTAAKYWPAVMPGYTRVVGPPLGPQVPSRKPAVAVGVKVSEIVVGVPLMVVTNAVVMARAGENVRVKVVVIPPVVVT